MTDISIERFPDVWMCPTVLLDLLVILWITEENSRICYQNLFVRMVSDHQWLVKDFFVRHGNSSSFIQYSFIYVGLFLWFIRCVKV